MKRKNVRSLQKNQLIEVAPCLFELNGQVPTEIKLTPAGLFKAKDGRPHGLKGWLMNDKAATNVLAAANAQQDQFLIDYEHQTLYSRENGQPAPAAAWYSKIEWRPGDGLYALGVEWTEAAKAAIESKEYRYISPVIAFNKKTGEVAAIKMAALVNFPAIDGLTDLAAAHFQFNTTEVIPVDEELLKLLGLDENATQEQVNQAVTALKQQADKVEPLVNKAGGLTDKVSELMDEVAALKANSGGDPDPSKYVPISVMKDMQTELAALSAKINGKELDELIEQGLSDGRLLESQKGWAQSLDVAALSAYLKDAPQIAALKRQQSVELAIDEEGNVQLGSEHLAVCKAMGLTEDEMKKSANKGGA